MGQPMARKRSSQTASEAPIGPRLQRVVIATDFSSGARAALNRVARLPLEARAELVVAYVIPAGGDLFVDRGAESAVEQLLEDEVRVLRRLLPKAKVRPELVRGRPAQALYELGKRLEPELIVLGRHGESNRPELRLGSTAERVLHLSHRPILVVSRPPRSGYRRVLAALDLAPGSVEFLASGLRIVGATPKEVTLVHAYGAELGPKALRTPARRAEQKRQREAQLVRAEGMLNAQLNPFPSLARSAKVVFAPGDPREVLVEQVAAQKADLLVVGTHGRSETSLALMGSVAQALAREAPCDVLVVPSLFGGR